MALQKEVVQPNKTVASYWKIFSVNIDYTTKKAVVLIKGYVNKPAREEAPKFPVQTKMLEVQLTDVLIDVRPECYSILKTLVEPIIGNKVAFFEGATDC